MLAAFSSPVKFSKSVFSRVKFRAKFEVVLQKQFLSGRGRCLYQEVYNRRENLRFLGFPEATHTEEVASEVVYQFTGSTHSC